jgi:hypothetical protein
MRLGNRPGRYALKRTATAIAGDEERLQRVDAF